MIPPGLLASIHTERLPLISRIGRFFGRIWHWISTHILADVVGGSILIGIGIAAHIYIPNGIQPVNGPIPIYEVIIEDYQYKANEAGSDAVDCEWVTIKNVGESEENLAHWVLADNGNHKFDFPAGFILGSGESVTVHTCHGANTSTDLYWGRDSAVWNDDRDTIWLYDSDQQLVDEKSYG